MIEQKVNKALKLQGYKVTRNGWPDFLVRDSDNKPFFIETKSINDSLQTSQKKMLQVLADLGFDVFIVSPGKKGPSRQFHNIETYSLNGNENLNEFLLRIEKEIITKALTEYKGSNIKTANYLGITNDSLKYRLLKIKG